MWFRQSSRDHFPSVTIMSFFSELHPPTPGFRQRERKNKLNCQIRRFRAILEEELISFFEIPNPPDSTRYYYFPFLGINPPDFARGINYRFPSYNSRRPKTRKMWGCNYPTKHFTFFKSLKYEWIVVEASFRHVFFLGASTLTFGEM